MKFENIPSWDSLIISDPMMSGANPCSSLDTTKNGTSPKYVKQTKVNYLNSRLLATYVFQCKDWSSRAWCFSSSYQPQRDVLSQNGVYKFDDYWPSAFDLIGVCK
jgi:hypothetical protein